MKKTKLQGVSSLICLLLLLSACKSTHVVRTGDVKNRRATYLLKQMKKQQIAYDWLGMKAKANYRDAEQQIQFILYVRMKKDSLIWLNVRKMGVEGMRARITPKQVEIMLTRDKKYIRKDFAYLQNQFNVPLSFNELQELLAGNLVRYDQAKLDASHDSSYYYMKGRIDEMQAELTLDAFDYFLHTLTLQAPSHEQIHVRYEQHEQEEDGSWVPRIRTIDVDTRKTGRASTRLKLVQFERNKPQRIPFEIPDFFEEIENVEIR